MSSFPTGAGDWNRETSTPRDYDANLPMTQEARLLVLGDPNNPNNARLYEEQKSCILGIGTKREDFDVAALHKCPPTVLVVTDKSIRHLLAELLVEFQDTLVWVHAISAGMEHCTSDTLSSSSVTMTNAKGHFSSTLAEYGMMVCSYFSKNVPRLLQQQRDCKWERYCIMELRGATLGIVGYGDIGHATARLAKAYGMKVIALKRKRKQGKRKRDDNDDSTSIEDDDDDKDPCCDKLYYSHENPSALNDLCSASDYLFVATPLTPQTKGMIGKDQFQAMKSTGVIINVGRGPVVDEPALVEALQTGKIKGAGLDVTAIEPLPKESPLWKMKNVLLSPHNMDATVTFMQEGTAFFLDENLPRFLRGLPLYNVVDKTAGY